MNLRLPLLLLTLAWLLPPADARAQLTPEQHAKLVETSRQVSRLGLRYNQSWNPPEGGNWAMDCSNTSRYIYLRTFNKSLPRTASDQYYDLKLKNRIIPAPLREDGSVDTQRLLKLLRSGDLLFWEWTYNIKRSPPITHVMVYLGQTASGAPRMVGSSVASTGEHTSRGGVDIYAFDPNANMGGVRSFFGRTLHKGRFVAIGRPLDELAPAPVLEAAAPAPSVPASKPAPAPHP
jgi:hypothetical protein